MEPTDIEKLIDSQWVELDDVIEQTKDALSIDFEKAKYTLKVFGLSEVRPIRLAYRHNDEEINPSSKPISPAIKFLLVEDRPLESVSSEVKYLIHDSKFLWVIHQLVYWFKEKKWDIPKKWQEWMKSTYPILEQRKLLAHPITISTQPVKNKREVRKLDTQAKYQSWQKEYRKLKKANPEKSDTWCSIQIEKMDIALGRDVETIRKNMKK